LGDSLPRPPDHDAYAGFAQEGVNGEAVAVEAHAAKRFVVPFVDERQSFDIDAGRLVEEGGYVDPVLQNLPWSRFDLELTCRVARGFGRVARPSRTQPVCCGDTSVKKQMIPAGAPY